MLEGGARGSPLAGHEVHDGDGLHPTTPQARAVLGPKTVPRKTREAIRNGVPEETFYKIHKDNPEKSYGIKIEI